MSTTILLDPENTLRALKAQINADMLKAAEPLVQAAVKAIEVAMRERLAESLVKLIDKSYSMERDGNDLRIIVARDQPSRDTPSWRDGVR